MPGVDGWEVCQRLRERSSVPIIMLTAKGEEFDKLRGFRLGVDDYVTKPFSFTELTARIGAVLARATRAVAPSHSLTSGDVTIDFDERRVGPRHEFFVSEALSPLRFQCRRSLQCVASGHCKSLAQSVASDWRRALEA